MSSYAQNPYCQTDYPVPCHLCLNDMFPISYHITTPVLRVLFLGGHEIAGLFGFLEHITNLLEKRQTNTFLTSKSQKHTLPKNHKRSIYGRYLWYFAVSWLRNCSSCKASFISISMRIISSCFILRILKAKMASLPSARLLGISRPWFLLWPFIFNQLENQNRPRQDTGSLPSKHRSRCLSLPAAPEEHRMREWFENLGSSHQKWHKKPFIFQMVHHLIRVFNTCHCPSSCESYGLYSK